MTLQLILLYLALGSCLTIVAIAIANGSRFRDVKNVSEFTKNIKELPIQGPIYSAAIYLFFASMLGIALLRFTHYL